MSWSWIVTNSLASLLLPPTFFVLVGALGLYLVRRRRRTLGYALTGFSLMSILLLSLPLVADQLLDTLPPPFVELKSDQAEAIVILGGGSDKDVFEYGGDTVNAFTLERIRYGARLARRFQKPVLTTGGAPVGHRPEGRLMAEVLDQEFGVPVRWVEEKSETTFENARFSAPLLHLEGIRRIFLVSHGWHLRRAIPEFERQGLEVTPAGIGYMPNGPLEAGDFIPNANALRSSYLVFHEWIGLIWYRLRNLME